MTVKQTLNQDAAVHQVVVVIGAGGIGVASLAARDLAKHCCWPILTKRFLPLLPRSCARQAMRSRRRPSTYLRVSPSWCWWKKPLRLEA